LLLTASAARADDFQDYVRGQLKTLGLDPKQMRLVAQAMRLSVSPKPRAMHWATEAAKVHAQFTT